MTLFHKITTTVLGIGYIKKGGGTVAAGICCLVWFFVLHVESDWRAVSAVVCLLTILGIWSSNKVELFWGKDSSKVVIDEVAGMAISLMFIPVEWKYVITGFLLFRFFDIAKVLYIRRLENLPGGWGVMGDDILAGIYANIILQCIVYFKLF